VIARPRPRRLSATSSMVYPRCCRATSSPASRLTIRFFSSFRLAGPFAGIARSSAISQLALSTVYSMAGTAWTGSLCDDMRSAVFVSASRSENVLAIRDDLHAAGRLVPWMTVESLEPALTKRRSRIAGWGLVRTHAAAAARVLPSPAPPRPLGATLLSSEAPPEPEVLGAFASRTRQNGGPANAVRAQEEERPDCT